ncbi:MAG: serine/threonine protein phosphatase [Ruminococcus sp.]|nr:serine/threonine protein phosphatase [Ruminococcus sp.]
MLTRKKKNRQHTPDPAGAFSAERTVFRLAPDRRSFEPELYEALRAEVPIIDACFGKIERLTNDFRLVCPNRAAQKELDDFSREVSVGMSGSSLMTFADLYLDTLLTYGRALGTIAVDKKTRQIKGMCIADPTVFRVERGKDPLDIRFKLVGSEREVKMPAGQRWFYTTLNPSVKHPEGVSVLRGVPALSDILMRIYECVGQNFDRVGNVRYAVTYKPVNEADAAFAKERAAAIAREWSDGMASARSGTVKDFVAVGDVGIKVIGADNQVLDTNIPVRQLLEQMISKLSIPPFLLGLNWSSTERMSSQQADILTSELEYYRRLISPVLRKIGCAFLRLAGYSCSCEVEWGNINLQDEEALARARLYNAQSAALEEKTKEGE